MTVSPRSDRVPPEARTSSACKVEPGPALFWNPLIYGQGVSCDPSVSGLRAALLASLIIATTASRSSDTGTA